LQAAANATVLEVVPQTRRSIAQGHVDDVAAWLEQHRVDVSSEVVIANGTEIGPLHAALLARKCDLLVAGAYGHNRLKEWVFGGVTMDMLLDPDFCVLLSH
jgi:nucleotide-binding universal stress UspA family protein